MEGQANTFTPIFARAGKKMTLVPQNTINVACFEVWYTFS
jgi:hypothetical protein